MIKKSHSLLIVILIILLACALPGNLYISPTPDLPNAGPSPSPTATIEIRSSAPPSLAPPSTETSAVETPVLQVRFAVIGDYGQAGEKLQAVAELVKSWAPDFVITTGDNNYPSGSAATIDENVGQYFHQYIGDYQGDYGEGALTNRFFPALGNHDWVSDNAQPYLDYFTLPGDERYYEFTWEFLHFFAIDSDWREPDGIGASSKQAAWLKERLAASQEPWKIVYLHTPPYSSGLHGSTPAVQWPFKEWGATVVISGHDHVYERLEMDGFTYITNGLGGSPYIYPFSSLIPGSLVRYNQANGAIKMTASPDKITFVFIDIYGEVIDEYTIIGP